MELELTRRYYPQGTNGQICCNGKLIAYSIELPWKNNHARVSCIPEGRYPLVKRYSPRFKWHLMLQDVPGRTLILMHPANDALLELQGCIAPVSQLTLPGEGLQSRNALNRINALVFAALARFETVLITIKS